LTRNFKNVKMRFFYNRPHWRSRLCYSVASVCFLSVSYVMYCG